MLSQAIINNLQVLPKHRIIRKLQYYGLYFARQFVLRFHNPCIHYPVGEKDLYFPLSTDFPFTRRQHPYYATNVARVAQSVRQKYHDLRIIDIGAYVGDTIALLRQQAEIPILGIEGDENVYRILEKNMTGLRQVDVMKALLGNPAGLLLEKATPLSEPQTSMSLMQVLARFPQYAKAKMLKIDTDGHDGQILRGASEFLSAQHPILFFEYDPDLLTRNGDNGLDVLRMLRNKGYTAALFYESTGPYMLSVMLDNTALLEDLTQWYSGYSGYRYYDICVFHADDMDLCGTIRKAEFDYFQNIQYCH